GHPDRAALRHARQVAVATAGSRHARPILPVDHEGGQIEIRLAGLQELGPDLICSLGDVGPPGGEAAGMTWRLGACLSVGGSDGPARRMAFVHAYAPEKAPERGAASVAGGSGAPPVVT